MNQGMVVPVREPVKRPVLPSPELSQAEVTKLVKAFVYGKREVLEDDVVFYLQWCTAQRLGALVVDLLMEGQLTALVEHGDVRVGLRPDASPCAQPPAP